MTLNILSLLKEVDMDMEERRSHSQSTTAQTNTPVMNFLFLSGVLALDLVNTEVVVRGKRYDLFSSPGDVARWWQDAITHHPDVEDVRGETQAIVWSLSLLETMKQIRAAIRTLCTNLVEHQPLEQEAFATLNAILAMGYLALELASEQELIPTYRTREAEQ